MTDSLRPKTTLNLPLAVVAVVVLSISGFVYRGMCEKIEQNRTRYEQQQQQVLRLQTSIDQTLAELRFNRERIMSHCDADKMRTAADVRDAMRAN